jgi:hypothetical protein
MTQQFITMAKDKGIEVIGIKELNNVLLGIPDAVAPSITRNILRKPANKIVSQARKDFKIKDTGATKRSIGLLKVRDRKQRFIEIGIKGRSLAWIFMLGAKNRKKRSGANTGSIKAIGNVIQIAAEKIKSQVMEMIAADHSKTIEKVLKKHFSRKWK